MDNAAQRSGPVQPALFGVAAATLAMALFWFLETLGFIVRGSTSGWGFESLTAFPSGPSLTLLLYLGVGLLPGAIYYGVRWRRFWRAGPAGRLFTAFWVALGLHLFLRLSTIYRIHPGLSVHPVLFALVPSLLFFILAGEAARAMALWSERFCGNRPHGAALRRAILFFLHAVLFIGLTIPTILGLQRFSLPGLGLFAGCSILSGGLALVGFRREIRMRSPWIWAFPVLGLVALQLGVEGCAGWTERGERQIIPAVLEAGNPSGPPIIQITIDTLRADRLSQYGGPEDTSPLFTALENDGAVRFVDCSSQAPWTVPSTSSMLTGLHPCRLGTVAGPLQESEVTLAERLGEAGYLTAAFSDNFLMTPGNGFPQGFGEFHFYGKPGRFFQYSLIRGNRNLTSILQRIFRQVYGGVDRLLPPVCSWLERNRDERFYLYLHLMDVHGPYYDHPGFRPQENGRPADRPVTITVPTLYAQKEARGVVEASPEDRDELLARYDAEIHHTGLALERLFAELRALGLWDRCLLLICSDHGEEFFEHGSWGHIHSVHRELLHVPLWIKPPASSPAAVRVVTQPVQNLDLVPTILDAAGLPVAGEGLAGKSLWPLIRGRGGEDEFAGRVMTAVTVYLYPRPLYRLSARQGELKCIREYQDNRESDVWYDLAADPRERNPLRGAPEGERAGAITDALDRLAHGLAESASEPGSDLQTQLRAMGYLQ